MRINRCRHLRLTQIRIGALEIGISDDLVIVALLSGALAFALVIFFG